MKSLFKIKIIFITFLILNLQFNHTKNTVVPSEQNPAVELYEEPIETEPVKTEEFTFEEKDEYKEPDYKYEEPTEYSEKEKTAESPLKFDISIPLLGTITLEGIIDMVNETFGLKGSPQKKSIDLGILKITNPSVTFTNKKGLQAQADVSILEQTGALKLEEFVIKKKARYSLTPKNGIKIPITPWNNITISKFDLIITKEPDVGGPATPMHVIQTLVAHTTIFNIPVDITFGLEPEHNFAEFKIPKLEIADLIKNLKDTPGGNIMIKNATFKIENPFKKLVPHPVTISGGIDFSKANLDFPVKITKLEGSIDIHKTKGLKIETSVPNFDIGDTKIKNIKLIYTSPPKPPLPSATVPTTPTSRQPTTATTKLQLLDISGKYKKGFSISGDIEANLPLGIGRITDQAFGKYEKPKGAAKGIFTLETNIGKNINFKNLVRIIDTKILVSTDGKVAIGGNARLLDMDVDARIEISKVEGKTVTSFFGMPKFAKPIYPFKNIPGISSIPGLENLQIRNTRFSFDKDKKIIVGGKCKVFGVDLDVVMVKTPQAVALKTKPGALTIAQVIPAIKGTIIEDIATSNATFIISSANYVDTELNVEIKKGFNVVADAILAGGSLSGLTGILKGAPKKLKLAGAFGSSLRDIKFDINIPLELKMGKRAIFKRLRLRVDGAGPSFGLASIIEVLMPKEEKPLTFIASADIEPTSAGFAGTMKNKWSNPLGIAGLALANVAIEVGIEYPVFAATGLPTIFGLTGEMDIGTVKLAMALKTSADLTDVILMGKVNRLTIKDIIALANKIPGPDIPLGDIPNIGLRNVIVKLAPKGGKIGEIYFSRGITLQGTLNILGQEAIANINVDRSGIIAQGTLSELNLGPLKLSGAGLDQKYGTADDGPTYSLALTPQKQHYFISGAFDLLGSNIKTDLYIGKKGIHFDSALKLLKIFDMKVSGDSSGDIKRPQTLDFKIKAELKNKIDMDFKKSDLKKSIDYYEKKLERRKREKKEKLNEIQGKIDKKTESLKRGNTGYKNLINGLQTAQNRLKGAENKVKELDNQIKNLKIELGMEEKPKSKKAKKKKTKVKELKYGDSVALNSLYGKYLSAIGKRKPGQKGPVKFQKSTATDKTEAKRNTPSTWETFVMINPDDPVSRKKIQNGSKLVLITYHGTLLGEQNDKFVGNVTKINKNSIFVIKKSNFKAGKIKDGYSIILQNEDSRNSVGCNKVGKTYMAKQPKSPNENVWTIIKVKAAKKSKAYPKIRKLIKKVVIIDPKFFKLPQTLERLTKEKTEQIVKLEPTIKPEVIPTEPEETITIAQPLASNSENRLIFSSISLQKLIEREKDVKQDIIHYQKLVKNENNYVKLAWWPGSWINKKIIKPAYKKIIKPAYKKVIKPAYKKVIKPAGKWFANRGKDIYNVGKKAVDAIAKEGGGFFKNPLKYGKLKALQTAREGAGLALIAARGIVNGLEESIKTFSSPEIMSLRTEQTAISAKYDFWITQLTGGVTMLKAALKTYPLVNKLLLPALIINVKNLSIEFSAQEMARGQLPKIECSIKAFDKWDKTFTIKGNIKDIPKKIIKNTMKLLLP